MTADWSKHKSATAQSACALRSYVCYGYARPHSTREAGQARTRLRGPLCRSSGSVGSMLDGPTPFEVCLRISRSVDQPTDRSPRSPHQAPGHSPLDFLIWFTIKLPVYGSTSGTAPVATGRIWGGNGNGLPLASLPSYC